MKTQVTSWRDLIAQLTPEQIADMEVFQRDTSPYAPTPETLLRIASSFIETNQLEIRFSHVPVPADCIGQPGAWESYDDSGEERFERSYICWQHPHFANAVQVLGHQSSDGTIERVIYSTLSVDETDASIARAIGAALIAAAEELDRLNDDAPPF